MYDQEHEWKEQVDAVRAAYRVVKAENIEKEREEQDGAGRIGN